MRKHDKGNHRSRTTNFDLSLCNDWRKFSIISDIILIVETKTEMYIYIWNATFSSSNFINYYNSFFSLSCLWIVLWVFIYGNIERWPPMMLCIFNSLWNALNTEWDRVLNERMNLMYDYYSCKCLFLVLTPHTLHPTFIHYYEIVSLFSHMWNAKMLLKEIKKRLSCFCSRKKLHLNVILLAYMVDNMHTQHSAKKNAHEKWHFPKWVISFYAIRTGHLDLCSVQASFNDI